MTSEFEAEALFQNYAPNSSNASWALRFAASHEGVMMVLSGMKDMQQMEDNVRTMKDFQPMNEEERNLCAQSAKMIQDNLAIPCTSCGYCTVQCPKHIPIPKYFSLFQHGYMTTQIVYYYSLSQTNPKAGDCIGCHQCEKHCPQHIEITRHLREISEKFDGFSGWR